MRSIDDPIIDIVFSDDSFESVNLNDEEPGQ